MRSISPHEIVGFLRRKVDIRVNYQTWAGEGILLCQLSGQFGMLLYRPFDIGSARASLACASASRGVVVLKTTVSCGATTSRLPFELRVDLPLR